MDTSFANMCFHALINKTIGKISLQPGSEGTSPLLNKTLNLRVIKWHHLKITERLYLVNEHVIEKFHILIMLANKQKGFERHKVLE